MMRIVAGRFKGRRLKAAPPAGVRPTSDKLRETLFNILGARAGEAVFLDAYAGVGGVGLEAVSRGAARVYFVERHARAAAALRTNLAALGLGAEHPVLETDLALALERFRREGVRFDLVFLDPPYARRDLYDRDLAALGDGGLLAEGGLLIAEHVRKMTMPDRAGRLVRVRTHPQGDSALSFYQVETA